MMLAIYAPLTSTTTPAPVPATTHAPAPTLPQAVQPAVVPLAGPNVNLGSLSSSLPDMGANAPMPARNDSVYESNVIPTTLLLTNGQNLVEPAVSGSTAFRTTDQNTYEAEPTHNPQGSFPDVELLASQS
nr:hypothetical protein [Tanacetum cinerariifolium]